MPCESELLLAVEVTGNFAESGLGFGLLAGGVGCFGFAGGGVCVLGLSLFGGSGL